MATYYSNDFRAGLKIMLDGEPYAVEASEFVKPGKGQAFARVKLRRLQMCIRDRGNTQSTRDEERMVEDEFTDTGSTRVIHLYRSNQRRVGRQNEQTRHRSKRSNSGQRRNVQCQSHRHQCFCGCSLRVQQSRSKEEDDGQQPRMTLNHFTSGIFDPCLLYTSRCV